MCVSWPSKGVNAATLLYKEMEYETSTNGGNLSEERRPSTSININMQRLLGVIQILNQFAPFQVGDLD